MENTTDTSDMTPSGGLFSNTLTPMEIEQLQKSLNYLSMRLKRSDAVSEYDLYEIENLKELLAKGTDCLA